MSTHTAPTLVTATDLTHYARSRLDHLTDGRPLYIPGFGTEADPVVASMPTTLHRHPYSVIQLPLLAVQLETMLDAEPATTWLISLAHLAHHDCPACVSTWTEAERCAQELPASSPQFHLVTLRAATLLVHYEDHP
ncbi:hypothetical protein ACNUDN_31985 (plasmid) [Mycobacterium sp. smrl_JER01]|jgi:hypothetical protein|uniref:hypothetical protein n=1 Tax=Mycobacterium sp. smrl_JER01 TaxID=3402633 RepID=UPI003AC0F7F6